MEINKTVQDLRWKLKKKTQMETSLEVGNLRKRTGAADSSTNNRIQDMEKRISGTEYKRGEINAAVKKVPNLKRFSLKTSRKCRTL